jgi:hypothetical protein
MDMVDAKPRSGGGTSALIPSPLRGFIIRCLSIPWVATHG